MMAQEDRAAADHPLEWQQPDGRPHSTPKAKSVIWLFMNGGVSHGELRSEADAHQVRRQDRSRKRRSRTCRIRRTEARHEWLVVNDANGTAAQQALPAAGRLQTVRASGIEVSDWLPHIGATCRRPRRRPLDVDDRRQSRCAERSSTPAGTCSTASFPTLGAWVHYGLGSLNDNLPQFISMGKREYWNKRDGHYLGPAHDAVPLRVDPNEPARLRQSPRAALSLLPNRQSASIWSRRLNALRGETYPRRPGARRRGSPRTSWRSACRRSVPEVLDFSQETEETQEALRPRPMPRLQ